MIIEEKNDKIVLSDRMKINWKEIILFPIPFFIVMLIITQKWILALIIGLFAGVLYMIFRFSAWILYSEIHIDSQKRNLKKITMLFDKVKKIKIITDKLSVENFEFKKLERSGKLKYLMNYKTHKDNTLLILKNKSDKDYISELINDLRNKF
jgi:hypothetical protein